MSRRTLLTVVGSAVTLLLAYVAFCVIVRSLARGPELAPAPKLLPPVTDLTLVAAPASLPKYLGVASCTAQACHGLAAAPGTKAAEYTTWSQEDLHARAYDVLLDARSQRMVESLGIATPAQQTQQCLACHATAVPDDRRGPRFAIQDGITCEACHGPAEHWLVPHVAASWKVKSPSEKAVLGMLDTDSLTPRLKLCVSCHVGTPGREVNHDLIAAGHPRLVFEAGAFHANWARHWDGAKERLQDPVREVRLWAVGQAVTAEAALTLMEARAGDSAAVWPEFTEYDCYACHHQLLEPGWRRQQPLAGRRPGAPLWGTWHFEMLPTLSTAGPTPSPQPTLEAIDELRRLMGDLNADRQEIRQLAATAVQGLAEWSPQLAVEESGFPRSILKQLAGSLVRPGEEAAYTGWDGAVQRLLAASALHAALVDISGPRPAVADDDPRKAAIDRLGHALQFPRGVDSPQSVSPEQVQTELKKLVETLTSP